MFRSRSSVKILKSRGFSNMVVRPTFKPQYGNFIGGKFVDPVGGKYFANHSPIDSSLIANYARSTAADIELALDAAHEASKTFAKTSATERSNLLLKIADRMEQNLERLAAIDCVDNGKAVRETLAADLPLCIDHFRYFAGVIRADEGSVAEIDSSLVSINVYEPLGVVGAIIPWNFPLLMAVWKIAPAVAAGNCVVIKPAEQTPSGLIDLMDLIQDILPPGVVNVVTGMGDEAGGPLTVSKRISKLAFTGGTETGKLIMKNTADNLIPVTMELGGKSPMIFFESVADHEDAFFDKAIEGFVLFALNQGEICTCPSRFLVHENIYDKFIKRVIERTEAIKIGHPLDKTSMMGAQASKEQYEKIMKYLEVGKAEGAVVLTGGKASTNKDVPNSGFYIEPTIFKGDNSMKIFQEEIFGPVAGVTTFKTDEEAIAIANDTVYGLGAGVWTRDMHQGYTVPRQIQAGRVWVNCYHLYPAHAPFGGYKQSGFGRENHKMMLSAYRHTKNMLVSYDKNKLGFF